MRRSFQFSVVLVAALMVVSPVASAVPPMLPGVIDDHLGDVDQRLNKANSTYGERSEFERSRASLARASLALLNNATVVSMDSLVKANGGLETGRARAQGGSGEDVVDHGRTLANEARSTLNQVRDSLESMEKTGLEPVAFSGGLISAYMSNRGLDMLQQYERALNQWENGNEQRRLATTIVSAAAGAKIFASLSSDMMREVAEARANSTATQLMSVEDLDSLIEDRVAWSNANSNPATKRSLERVNQMNDNEERLMTVSGFLLHFQNVVFNGVRQEAQRNDTLDPFQEAETIYDRESPKVDAWLDEYELWGGLAHGSMASANMTLVLNQNQTGDNRERSGAFALGLAHLGAETAAYYQQGYGNLSHEPGTPLKSVSASADGEESLVPGLGVLAALATIALAAIAVRRGRR